MINPSARALLENPGFNIPASAFRDRETFEKVCKESAISNNVLCGVLHSYWLAYDPDDESLTPNLKRDGFWESWVSVAIGRYLKPGMHCIDIGANVGYFTLLMADRVGEQGMVMAIEPQPKCAELLRQTLAVNAISLRSWCVEVAVSNRKGIEGLLMYGSLHGSASLHEAPGWEITERISVPLTTLDDLMRGLPIPELIKIDAEGAESEIWAGMKETIARSPHLAVCMEVCSKRHYDLGALLSRIHSDGFPLRVVNESGDIEDMTVQQIADHGEELPTLWLQRELVHA